MFRYTAKEVNKIADSSNFNRNMTEKVLRLYSILDYFNNKFGDVLVLKGGTAINLFVLDLPRLSVDIDLDFNLKIDKEEMLNHRKRIDSIIKGYMEDEGYYLSDKSKFTHSLDSYVFSYTTTSNSKDVLKIEINYSNRVHILKPVKKISTDTFIERVYMNCLADCELIGSKINALLTRTTPRDVYDVYNIFKLEKLKDEKLVRKIAIFYVCLGSDIPINFESILNASINKISKLNFQKIKETLIPVLHKGIKFNVDEMCDYVSSIIKKLFVLDDNDIKFISIINNNVFEPNILFTGYEIEDLTKHPIGIWKTLK